MIDPSVPTPIWYSAWLQKHFCLTSLRHFTKYGPGDYYVDWQLEPIEGSPYWNEKCTGVLTGRSDADEDGQVLYPTTDTQLLVDDPWLVYRYVEVEATDLDPAAVVALGEDWQGTFEDLIEECRRISE